MSSVPSEQRPRRVWSGRPLRGGAAAVVVCLSLAVASYHCTFKERPMVTQDGLELETNVTADDKHLFVHYTVKNTEATTAYLFNLVNLPEKGFTRVHKDHAYVYVDGSEVLVEKAVPEIPRGVHPYEPVTPYMTAVEAGASFEETVELPLPLRDTRPYRGGPPSDDVIRVDGVRFSLGYLRVRQGSTHWPIPAGDATAVQFDMPPDGVITAGQLEATCAIRSAQTGEKVTVPAVPPKL